MLWMLGRVCLTGFYRLHKKRVSKNKVFNVGSRSIEIFDVDFGDHHLGPKLVGRIESLTGMNIEGDGSDLFVVNSYLHGKFWVTF